MAIIDPVGGHRYNTYGSSRRYRPPFRSPALGLLLAVVVLGAATYFAFAEMESEGRSCGSALSPDDGYEVLDPTGSAPDAVALGNEDSPCDDRVEERFVHIGVGIVVGLSTALGLGTGAWLLKGSGDGGGGGGDGGGGD